MSCKCVQVGRWGLAHSLHSCGGQGSNQDFKISFFLSFFPTQIHFFMDFAFTQGHHSADLLKFLAQSWKHTIFWNMVLCCAIICSFNGIYLFIHYRILLLSYWSMSDIWLSRAERETSRQCSPHSHQCKIYSIALSMIIICTKNSCVDYRLKQMKRLKKEDKGKRKSLMKDKCCNTAKTRPKRISVQTLWSTPPKKFSTLSSLILPALKSGFRYCCLCPLSSGKQGKPAFFPI